jgi:urea transport system substrate-binding protein
MAAGDESSRLPLRPGDVIAEKYLVIRVLASGGMGVVVAARHRQLHRVVAIKFLREGMAAREGVVARFEREGRLIAGLTGEHVAKVFDFGRLATGEPFIVMELLEGETVGDRIRRLGALRAAEAVSFALQACDGLAEAHAAGIIHRDLKPQNLFICKRIDDTESIKIIDFGISKAREAPMTLTQEADVIGTPAYMAPEQFECPGSVDERADVWSMGALLYEALSARLPFVADGVLQIVSAVIKTEPKPLAELGIAPELSAIVHRCLAKDPKDRYQSVLELARALTPHATESDKVTGSSHWDGAARLERIEKMGRHKPPSSSDLPLFETGETRRSDRQAAIETNIETSVASVQAARPSSARSRSAPPSVVSRRRMLGVGVTAGAMAGLALAAGVWSRRKANPIAAAVPLAPPVTPGESGAPIRVGLLHSLTGTMASSESSLVDAVLLAIARVNAAGGVLGRPVEAIVRDGCSRADTFVDEARKLLDEDKVPVVFGCWTSTSRRAVRPLFEARGRPLFYSVQYEGIEASPAIVYLGAAPNQQLIPAVRWAFAFLERRSFFLVGSDYVFPRVATEILKDQLRALGATIAGEAFLPLGSVNVASVVQRAKKSGATMILNTINGDTNLAFIRELRAAGVTSDEMPILSFSLDQTGYRELDSSLVAGDYLAWNYFESFDSQENRDFLRALHDRFGPRPVTDPMATSYSAVLLWAAAAQRAGSLDLAAIRSALGDVSVSTPLGELRVNRATQHAIKTIAIGQIGRDGKVQVVWSAPKPVEATPFPDTRSREEWEKLLTKLQRDWGGKWEAPR